jgi:hypothetical protein
MIKASEIYSYLVAGKYMDSIFGGWYSNYGLYIFIFFGTILLLILVASKLVQNFYKSIDTPIGFLRSRKLQVLTIFMQEDVKKSKKTVLILGWACLIFSFIYLISFILLTTDPNKWLTTGLLQKVDSNSLEIAIKFLYLFALLGVSLTIANLVISSQIALIVLENYNGQEKGKQNG